MSALVDLLVALLPADLAAVVLVLGAIDYAQLRLIRRWLQAREDETSDAYDRLDSRLARLEDQFIRADGGGES
jgi:GrpB-like predicted nucleotidyltransferase (UPF0157 family)